MPTLALPGWLALRYVDQRSGPPDLLPPAIFAMSASLLVHDATLRTAIEGNDGYVFTTAGDYFGPVVNTAARVEAAGHGGQVLITDAVRTAATTDVTDLGMRTLRDVAEPLRLFNSAPTRSPLCGSSTRRCRTCQSARPD